MRARGARARGVLACAIASFGVASLGAGASTAAAPIKPKNGLYQGVTGQNEPLGFRVRGRDTIGGVFFSSEFGTCGFRTTGGSADINNRGRFEIVVDLDERAYTLRGRFVSKTKARGNLVFSADSKATCGVTQARTRFKVTRTRRVR